MLSAWTTIHLCSYHHPHLPSRLHTSLAPSLEPLRIPPSQSNLAFPSCSQLSSAVLSLSHCCLFSFDIKVLPNDMTDWTSPSYLLTLRSECQVLVLCMASDTVRYHIVERHSQAVRHFPPYFLSAFWVIIHKSFLDSLSCPHLPVDFLWMVVISFLVCDYTYLWHSTGIRNVSLCRFSSWSVLLYILICPVKTHTGTFTGV